MTRRTLLAASVRLKIEPSSRSAFLSWTGRGLQVVFQDLHERHAEEGLLVLGLATDAERASGVQAFLEKREITFPVGTASDEIRASFDGVDVLPTTVLIDRQGRIRHRVEGLMAPPVIRAAVRRLLEGR